MNTRPPDLVDRDIADTLASGWGISAVDLEYAPVGFGSHHWITTDTTGTRWFATVDDLRRATLAGLEQAFTTARMLHDEARLTFVLAPERGTDGALLHAVGDHFSLAVFRYIDGVSAPYGDFASDADRDAVLTLLAQLHASTHAVEHLAATDDLALPDRDDLETALRELTTEWHGGPFAEPARAALADNAEHVCHALAAYDDFAAAARRPGTPQVITHGEPHAANVMTTDTGPVLIDWDTVKLACPERDLARVVGEDADEAAAYEEASGNALDPDRLLLYSLWWDLAEIAGCVACFRQSHTDTADTRVSFKGLGHYIRLGEHYPGLLD